MVDLKAKAEENERIKRELMALPQAAEICLIAGYIKGQDMRIEDYKKQIAVLQQYIKDEEEFKQQKLLEIKSLLTEVEAASGYSKMPLGDYGTAYLREVKDSYEILNAAAVPQEYIKSEVKESLAKGKISTDVKLGTLKNNNWLKIKEPYKTVVISA